MSLIHIPIILTVFVPLLLKWKYAEIFTPVHVIFFELIIGPTCSIVYENEPADKDVLSQTPHPFKSSLFSWDELLLSIVQGLVITAGLFSVYWYAWSVNYSEPLTRSLVFICLISANFVLTLANRSFDKSLFTTLKYKNDLVWWALIISTLLCSLILLAPALRTLFRLDVPDPAQPYLAFWPGLYRFIGLRFTNPGNAEEDRVLVTRIIN